MLPEEEDIDTNTSVTSTELEWYRGFGEGKVHWGWEQECEGIRRGGKPENYYLLSPLLQD